MQSSIGTNMGMFPDETISSWALRQNIDVVIKPGDPFGGKKFPEKYLRVINMKGRLTKSQLQDKEYFEVYYRSWALKYRVQTDSDYGTVLDDFQDHPAYHDLKLAAKRPAKLVLRPHDRTLSCPYCDLEDFLSGRVRYQRRSWTVAWRTACPMHGPLSDSRDQYGNVNFVGILQGKTWPDSDHKIISHWGGKRPLILDTFYIGSDRRAIFLESALDARLRSEALWWPGTLSRKRLHDTYCSIVRALCVQSRIFATKHLEPGRKLEKDEQALGPFLWIGNSTRFAINVLAEAIISQWTETPLPVEAAIPYRTKALVELSGWRISRPRNFCPRSEIYPRRTLACPNTVSEIANRAGLKVNTGDSPVGIGYFDEDSARLIRAKVGTGYPYDKFFAYDRLRQGSRIDPKPWQGYPAHR